VYSASNPVDVPEGALILATVTDTEGNRAS
jgi:hypothetical protein